MKTEKSKEFNIPVIFITAKSRLEEYINTYASPVEDFQYTDKKQAELIINTPENGGVG